MGNIVSEGLNHIGSIDNDGYVYDQGGRRYAKIETSGYIHEEGTGKIYGKIDEDGSIRDSKLNVVGRIQADGYVYIHSKRICRVSSAFIEKITPKAWNAGEPSSFSGRKQSAASNSSSSSGKSSFFSSSFFVKLILGIILGIVAMVNGWGDLSMLIAGPVVVFMLSFFAKLFG